LGPGKGEEVVLFRGAAGVLLKNTEGNRVASLFAATPELVVGDITAPMSSWDAFSIAAKRWLRRLVWTADESNMFSLLRKVERSSPLGTFTPDSVGCEALPVPDVLKKVPATRN
jgi:hypothetical protein